MRGKRINKDTVRGKRINKDTDNYVIRSSCIINSSLHIIWSLTHILVVVSVYMFLVILGLPTIDRKYTQTLKQGLVKWVS